MRPSYLYNGNPYTWNYILYTETVLLFLLLRLGPATAAVATINEGGLTVAREEDTASLEMPVTSLWTTWGAAGEIGCIMSQAYRKSI